jgi:hypothetical protein
VRTALRSVALATLGVAALASAQPLRALEGADVAHSDVAPRVCVHDSLERLHREVSARWECPPPSEIAAFRGETVAFQLAVTGPARVSVHAEAPLPVEVFVEHFVAVTRRSSTGDLRESLGFSADARGDDAAFLGAIPDALVPVDRAPAWLYPVDVAPGDRAVFFVEMFIPEDATPGPLPITLTVDDGRAARALTVPVSVLAPVLPYAPVSVLAYYERQTLDETFGAHADAVEIEVARTLRAHHVESFTRVTSVAEAQRVRGSFDGSWYRGGYAGSYRGPGAGRPSPVFVLGAYGRLEEPTDPQLALAAELEAHVPDAVSEVVLYAIDETCESPLGGLWRTRLRDAKVPRVRVLHTCGLPPADQDVDVVAMPAQAFDPELAREARAHGQSVWAYNGRLPRAGGANLDVPLASLALNGWIAALHDVGRWFYWETVFWQDGNRGGLGPRDPFASAETFHNQHGDLSLYDGLLLFPGRLDPALGPHDLGFDGVAPSLRLKALRRGIEDAGLLALAALADPEKTHDLARSIVRASLDEVPMEGSTRLVTDPYALALARARLRALALESPREPPHEAAALGLRKLRWEHEDFRTTTSWGQPLVRRPSVLLLAPVVLLALGVATVRLLERRAAR